MVDRLKILAIALAIAVVLSALALALAVDPISENAGSDGKEDSSGSGGGDRVRSDYGSDCCVETCGRGSNDPCPAPEPCPEPDICTEPGTIISALAAI